MDKDRLIILRKSKSITQAEVAKNLGVERTTYVRYEKGEIQPPADMIVRIANYFNVTTDYILGVESGIQRDYFRNSDDEFAWLDELSADEIAERCFQDFHILFSRSNKSTKEQMKGFYIDTFRRFNS